MPLNANQLLIRPFHPQDQKEVKDLILDGLMERWGSLDPSRNHDLDDITTSYSGALFLVTRLDGRLVGTGALLPYAQEVGEIVRMSVEKACRRRGIGRLILRRLLEHAQQSGYRQVILETTATWQEAINFYLDNGFQVTQFQDGDIYFCLDLASQILPETISKQEIQDT
jgi:ribosomal protein S18 acetylase RimI-like enzyme